MLLNFFFFDPIGLLVDSLGFSIYMIMLPVNIALPLYNLDAFYFCFYLIVLVRAFSTVLNIRHP